jgi:hypothetical protein
VIQTCRIRASLPATRHRCDDVFVRFRVLASAAPAVLLACATARTPSTPRETALASRVEAPGLLFEVSYGSADAQELPRIEQGLLAAGARVARWGSFREGVLVRVLPDHAALEDAVDRHGYPWLRAWAFGDLVLLQSPRSWTPGAADEEVAQLIAHEVTHALMYQLLQPGEGPALATEEPPLWFREGMASVTAGQERYRLSGGDLSRWATSHPGADLLRPAPELYRTEKDAVYSAAHRAFELLLRLTGEHAVRDLLQKVSTGVAFPDAFRSSTGHSLTDFERDAIRSGFDPAGPAAPGTAGAGSP